VRRPRPALPLAAGWALLALAWAIGNPQFAAPDEGDHYLRAAALSGGTLVGADAPDYVAPQPTAAAREWMEQTARRVTIPAGLGPPPTCYILDPAQSAGCIDDQPAPAREVVAVTPVGTYQPLPYLLPAAALTVADDPAGGDRLARVAGLLPALALLVAAALCVGVLGTLAAVTPMAIYSAATLNGSGLEIAAGVAFAAALLRVARPGGPAGAGVWVLAGVGGAVLALSRSTGPAWVVVIVALAVARWWAGRAGATADADARVARTESIEEGATGRARFPRAAVVAGGVVLLAVIANRVWEAAYGADATLSLIDPRGATRAGFEQWGGAVDQLVGGFGYLETDIPLVLALAWGALLLALLVLAARDANRRERLVLGAAVAGAVLGPVALYVVLIRHTGFGLQGRHVLPVIAALPLLAAELIRRQPAALLPAAGAVAAVVHLGAWFTYARRSATGTDGPFWFLPDAEWTPPGGYELWLAAAVAGAALTAAAALAARRDHRVSPEAGISGSR